MAKLHMCKELFDLIFPIGYIYTSMNSTDPKTLLGYGTWTQIKDEFLYCTTSSNTTGGANSVSYRPAGSVSVSVSGSVASHAITIAEMPSHAHDVLGFPQNGGSSYGLTSASGASGKASSITWGILLGQAVANGGNAGHTHGFTGSGSGSFSGTSATINTMPKYRTCYAWYRTA